MAPVVPVGARNLAFRIGTSLHEAAFRLSRGRVLGRAGGMKVLVLTTRGRRTGRRRTTMLTAPVCEADRVVLVASFGGARHHPAWFLNVRAAPDVEVTMDGRTRRMRARVATADERAALWPRVVAAYSGYGRYQSRTGGREIPLVILEP